MKTEYNDIKYYLRKTNVINCDSPAIIKKSDELTNKYNLDSDKARILFEWVRDCIPHSKDIKSEFITRSADEVLSKGTGTCYSKTILLATMLRIIGIPAGFCYQVLYLDEPAKGTLLHALNGIYISSNKKWIRLDSRGNTSDYNGQFSLDEEKLVFPENCKKSKLIYDTIYADPAPIVIETLNKFENLNQMLLNMPQSL